MRMAADPSASWFLNVPESFGVQLPDVDGERRRGPERTPWRGVPPARVEVEAKAVEVEEVVVDRRADAGGEEQDGGLAEHPAGGQDHARNQARDRQRQDDVLDRLPLGSPEGQVAAPFVLRDRPKGLLGESGHQRQVEEGQRQRAAEGGEAPVEVVDEQDQPEQSDDDGRHRADGLFGEADRARDDVVARVLGHVDAAQDAHRDGDEHRQNEHVDGVPEDRQDAAQGRVCSGRPG